MKSLKLAGLLVFSGLCLWQGAQADTIEEDGSLTLSSTQADDRPTPRAVEVAAPLAVQDSKKIADKAKYNQLVEKIARLYGLESALLHAVISVESHYIPTAVSNRGAVGLMQLMPGTAKRYGVANAFDPVQNVHGGAKYLRDLLVMFNSDLSLALAAYNAGEFSVIRNGNRIPTGRGTEEFVARVTGFYHRYQDKH
ncbi:MAG: lytic transglycosylase domain-containing protein [Sulfuricella sp.]|nr:lytic transglycosylase domain-containing protein [Sulfuricella sp.]